MAGWKSQCSGTPRNIFDVSRLRYGSHTKLTNRSSNILTDQPAFEDFVNLVLTNGAGNKAVNFGHALLRHLAAQQIWRKLFHQKSGRKFSSVVIRFVYPFGLWLDIYEVEKTCSAHSQPWTPGELRQENFLF